MLRSLRINHDFGRIFCFSDILYQIFFNKPKSKIIYPKTGNFLTFKTFENLMGFKHFLSLI